MTTLAGERDHIGMAQSRYTHLYGEQKDARAISSYDVERLFGQKQTIRSLDEFVSAIDLGGFNRFQFPLDRFPFHRQQASELLVALEQEFYPLRVVGKCGLAVASIHNAVEGMVGFDQCGRHGERVVEVGEGC